MTYSLFYSPSSGQALPTYSVQQLIGQDPNAIDVEVLNSYGWYPVNQTETTANPNLYNFQAVYTIDGNYADQTWVYTPVALSDAKVTGTSQVKTSAKDETEVINAEYGLNAFSFAGIASQTVPPTRYQDVLDSVTAITDQLDADLTSIEAATTVDEIDSIIEKPYGVFVSGRGGAGPRDMNPSYFSALNNLPPGVGEAQLEIYIPGTNTVIPYDAGLPSPYFFDSAGNCYTGTDYRTTFRIAATGQVLGTVIPAFGANVPIPWTYNPVIPSLGGGSSSSAR